MKTCRTEILNLESSRNFSSAFPRLLASVHVLIGFNEFQTFYSMFLRKDRTEAEPGLWLVLTSYLLNSEITFKDKLSGLVFLLNK